MMRWSASSNTGTRIRTGINARQAARGDAVAHIGFLRQGNAPARGQGLDVDAKVFMKHEDGLEAIVQSSGSGSAAPVAPAWPGWGSHCTLMRDS
jgi:hypothetical protein